MFSWTVSLPRVQCSWGGQHREAGRLWPSVGWCRHVRASRAVSTLRAARNATPRARGGAAARCRCSVLVARPRWAVTLTGGDRDQQRARSLAGQPSLLHVVTWRYWYFIPSPYSHSLDGVPVLLGWVVLVKSIHYLLSPYRIWSIHMIYPHISGQLLKLTPIPFLCDLLVLFYISLFWTFPVALHRNYNYQLLNSFLLSTTSWCVAALVVIVKMWWPYLVSSRAGNEALQRLRLYNHGEGPF